MSFETAKHPSMASNDTQPAVPTQHPKTLRQSSEELRGEGCALPPVTQSCSPPPPDPDDNFPKQPDPAPPRVRMTGVGACRSSDLPSSVRRESPSASLEFRSNSPGARKKEKMKEESAETEKEIVEKKVQEEEEESKGAVGGSFVAGEIEASIDTFPEGGSVAEPEEKMERIDHAAQTDKTIEEFVQRDYPDLPLDHPVFVLVDHKTRCLGGKIKWTGAHFAIHESKLAVVELDENYHEASNGRFLGQSLCHTKRNRALLVEVRHLLHRSPFAYGQRVHTFQHPNRVGTVWNLRGSHATVEWDHSDPRSEEAVCESLSIALLNSLPSFRGEPLSFPIQPIGAHRLHELVGRHRGIQGDSNSCYLDTTLFCLFGFSSFWEEQILESDRKRRDILLHQVVFPLRAHGFVPACNVRRVRDLLCAATGRGEFASQSRDLPETLEALLGKTLNVPPMVMTSSLGRDAVSFPASFSIETVPPPKQPKVCTSQHFLESSAVMMEFQLTAMPKCLILLLPRERGYHMKEVIPALELDLEPVLEGGTKLCYVCGQEADTQCPQRMSNCSAASTFFCSSCLKLDTGGSGGDDDDDGAPARRIPLKPAGRRKSNCRMLLSAVICISHSHYNCFVRCGQEWIFFDSMSDRDSFSGSQICIPRIRRANLNHWIRQKLAGNLGISAPQCDRDISDRAFSCPYALIYNAPGC